MVDTERGSVSRSNVISIGRGLFAISVELTNISAPESMIDRNGRTPAGPP
jgi:hypothetical protein